ncbi:MAG: hypothetical protein HYT31_02675 [Parcubacteria group bacterium]|nr:hypothetical protein [Parcubacteria group bacterium]
MDKHERERHCETAKRLYAGRRVSVTSRDFTEPVVLDVLRANSNRGCPFQELYSLYGIDVPGGFVREVGFWEGDTCINVIG